MDKMILELKGHSPRLLLLILCMGHQQSGRP